MQIITVYLAVIGLVFLTAHCSDNTAKDSSTSPPETPPVCNKTEGLGFHVVEGQDASKVYPEVLQLTIKKGDATSRCTGSFYSPRILITAAHCTKGADRITLEATGESTTEVFSHPEWAGDNPTTIVNRLIRFVGPDSLFYRGAGRNYFVDLHSPAVSSWMAQVFQQHGEESPWPPASRENSGDITSPPPASETPADGPSDLPTDQADEPPPACL